MRSTWKVLCLQAQKVNLQMTFKLLRKVIAQLLFEKAHEDVRNPQGIHLPTTSPIINYHQHFKFSY